MAIIKIEDVVAWDNRHSILCFDCGGDENDEPLTDDYFEEDDIVTCDKCGKRIK